jgi:hypothetical protein
VRRFGLMLALSRGTVEAVERQDERVAHCTVRHGGEGEPRPAIAYPALVGRLEPGDEVVVNTEALDLGLGSGGFDIVHVNLSRLREGAGPSAARDAHVMKLNYTSSQHSVAPVEEGDEALDAGLDLSVCVLALHGQLAPAAFAFARRADDAKLGYIQTPGGALPAALSDVVARLVEDGTLVGHVSAAACFGAAHEAITVEGALHAARQRLGWDAVLLGPGPGIIGSASALGHGGIAALANAHAALALGCRVVLAPRLSSGDPRERHRGLSHHTATVLELLLEPVTVACPQEAAASARDALAAAASRHSLVDVSVGGLLEEYRGSGLPATTMGRSIDEDRDFFRAALAAGDVLADLVTGARQARAR